MGLLSGVAASRDSNEWVYQVLVYMCSNQLLFYIFIILYRLDYMCNQLVGAPYNVYAAQDVIPLGYIQRYPLSYVRSNVT